ncbi:MAG TPA: hypothetical protein VM582_07825, partial [Candidatus Thermoplasmatota archaeon]|nr:hypothetical protein [Candidatus Thermoplasmatota archaeon]
MGALGVTYPVSLRAQALGNAIAENDAGSGQDAGDTPETALLLTTARRIWSANLTPPGTDSDWYRLPTSGAYCAIAEANLGNPGEVTLTGATSRTPAVSRSLN